MNLAWKIVGGLILLVIAGCSMTITSIVQPASITAGSILPVTLNVTISTNAAQTSKFMVAILVPKVWNAGQNTTLTFTSDISSGPQQMTLIPAGTAAPNGNGLDWPTYLLNTVGNGGNLLPDYEWVAFYSNSTYAVTAGATINATVTIQIQTSPDNLLFKLGYCTANSSDGLSDPSRFGTYFPGCFESQGTGDLIDFCNPQLSTVNPRTSLDNDIITLSFDGGVTPNALSGASQVYLCATGTTTSGDSIVRCVQNAQTKMTSLGLSKWQIDIWPRQLFNLADTQHLARLSYYFTDPAGNNKVGYGGGTAPFSYNFNCQ